MELGLESLGFCKHLKAMIQKIAGIYLLSFHSFNQIDHDKGTFHVAPCNYDILEGECAQAAVCLTSKDGTKYSLGSSASMKISEGPTDLVAFQATYTAGSKCPSGVGTF